MSLPGTPHVGKHAAGTAREQSLVRAHATLQAFDSGSYLATVQLNRSPDTTLTGVPVSRAIPSADLVVGSILAIVFFDHENSADAMVVGVY